MAVESDVTEHVYQPGSAMLPEALSDLIFMDSDELIVESWTDDALAGTVLLRDVDYSVSGDGTAGSATIKALAARPASEQFRVRRKAPAFQPEKFPKSQPLSSADIERGLDRLTLRVQEMQRDVSKAVIVPPGEDGFTIPARKARADHLPIFDQDGDLSVMAQSNVIVALDAKQKPVGVPVFDILSSIGTTIHDDGTWGGDFSGDDGVWG